MGIDLGSLSPAAQGQALQKRKAAAIDRTARRQKYHNVPEHRGEIRFDSKKEARRYDELLMMLHAGEIRNLRLQQQFTLQESYLTPEGERVRAIRYVADFAYERATSPDCTGLVHWLPVVEDVKSTATKTPQYELKKKLLQGKFGITITEVC